MIPSLDGIFCRSDFSSFSPSNPLRCAPLGFDGDPVSYAKHKMLFSNMDGKGLESKRTPPVADTASGGSPGGEVPSPAPRRGGFRDSKPAKVLAGFLLLHHRSSSPHDPLRHLRVPSLPPLAEFTLWARAWPHRRHRENSATMIPSLDGIFCRSYFIITKL